VNAPAAVTKLETKMVVTAIDIRALEKRVRRARREQARVRKEVSR
jgi:hypothetical protein